ncbi:MAG TPA: hypothetical protein VFS00_26350 [Polyangiaceae bacterium]|nr:hypothetical protein [Polyangiaceae bacterium]
MNLPRPSLASPLGIIASPESVSFGRAPFALCALLAAFAACSGGRADEGRGANAPEATASTTPASALPASASAPASAPPSAPPSIVKPMPGSIGVAKMLDNGTLVLDLYHPAPAQLTYPPTHPEYAGTLRHLGGMRPGESKGVPPWPDGINDAKVEAALRAYLPKKGFAYERCQAEVMGTTTETIVVHARCHERPLSLSLRKGSYEVVDFTDNGPPK